jgi:hypothetical protein
MQKKGIMQLNVSKLSNRFRKKGEFDETLLSTQKTAWIQRESGVLEWLLFWGKQGVQTQDPITIERLKDERGNY